MAVVELVAWAPIPLDKSEEVKKLDEELRRMFGLLVCFYTPVPSLMPVQQMGKYEGGWPYRFVEKDSEGKVNRDLLASLNKELERRGFRVLEVGVVGNHVKKANGSSCQ